MTNKVLTIILDGVSKARLAAAATPNIDRLRDAGRSFPRFTSAANASSAMAKLVSGLYTHREKNRVFGSFKGHRDRGGMPSHPYALGFTTYRAHWLGKWGLVDGEDVDHAETLGFTHDGSLQDLDPGGCTAWRRTVLGEDLFTETGHANEIAAEETLQMLNAGEVLVVAAFNAESGPFRIEHVDNYLAAVIERAFALDYQIVFLSNRAVEDPLEDSETLYEKTLNVDLILAGSTVAGRGESDAVADMTDLHATIWTWLVGLPPARTDGTSLVGMQKPRRYAFADMGTSVVGDLPAKWDRSIRSASAKLIANGWDRETLGGETESFELYDLVNDPDEEWNLAGRAEHGAFLDELRNELAKTFSEPAGSATMALKFRPQTEEVS